MNLPRNSKGFTLIELLISVSIIAILAGGIIPNFSQYMKDQNLKQVQEQLKSDLRTIQNKALTGSLSYQAFGDDRVAYWGVMLTAGSGTSIAYFVTTVNNACPPVDGTFENQGSFELTKNVKYFTSEIPAAGTCLFFDIRNGDISTYPVDFVTNGKIPVNYENNAEKNKIINFNKAGLIY